MFKNNSHGQNELLIKLYEAANLPGIYACRKGCSTCCTQSVTITGLEGELILAYLQKHGKKYLEQPFSHNTFRPASTTNQFVRQYIEQDTINDPSAEWSQDPCPFLSNGVCTVYPVRPFMCRSFVSTSNCSAQGFAEAPSQLITFNTIVQQVIEHLSAGKPWGLMIDIIPYQIEFRGEGKNRQSSRNYKNQLCQKISAIIISDREKLQLRSPLSKLKTVLEKYYTDQSDLLEMLIENCIKV